MFLFKRSKTKDKLFSLSKNQVFYGFKFQGSIDSWVTDFFYKFYLCLLFTMVTGIICIYLYQNYTNFGKLISFLDFD